MSGGQVAADLGVDQAVESGLADPAAVGERNLVGRVWVALALDLAAPAAVRPELARGPDLVVMAVRHLFRESLPAPRAADLPGAVNQQKKSCSGFLVH